MAHQVLARKWRPRCFQEVIGQAPVVRALSNALDQQYLHHAYLFTGTRGVGKTTISRILAKCLNCEKGVSANPCNDCENCREIDEGRFPDLFEVDAASRTKVEDTRELLDNIPYAPTKGRFKVYLIDEVHMLSGHSFNALLKTLEEPPSHVKFILATTDHHKLPVTVLSRCLQFHLAQLPPLQIAAHCQHLLKEENVEFENAALDLLARAANGSVRDALSLLDQSIAYGNGKVLIADLKTMLGTIEPLLLFDILEALAAKAGDRLLGCVTRLVEQGVDFSNALADLLSLLHQIAIIQTVPEALIENDSEQLRQLAKLLDREDVQLFYQIGLIGQRDLAYSPTPQTGFEMTLLRMLAFYPSAANAIPETESKEAVVTPTPKSSETSWPQLLSQLKLTGATLALAQQCSLKELTDNRLYLMLNPKQKPLLQQKHIERISEALSEHFNRTITVKIDISNHQTETPAALAQKKAQDRQTEAEKRMMNDRQVQRIMQTFDATLVKESIVPHDEGA
ncbi:DNA polymerase III subunit gamma/tau [Coxiella burnetii]|uniref:DNA polymerase III subunit gamma/tau n=1 Tax=Coxiella burnetii TaxID=777 RepID=UPI000CCBDC27|nr:DNA polymerase III subunit gamma/tau [Coxiella burnetii]PNT88773.1 DNA polymerase III subunit gamma/tau [Coxiella burnetii]